MQATINYSYYPQQAVNIKANPAQSIIRKEAAQKTALFAGILVCLLLAVII